jgi:curved DNA-binding protein CbpA
MEDYYGILGIPPNATFEAIREAFRRQAMLLHPDRNHAPNATEAFQRLSHAHDILKDGQKRSSYDFKLRAEKLKYRSATPAPPTPGPAKDARASDNHYSYDEKEESSIFYDDFMDSPLAGAFRSQPPSNPLRTQSDLANAQIELQRMKTEYSTKLKHKTSEIKAACAVRNTQQSEEDAISEAETQWEMAQHKSRIAIFESAIKRRFEELVIESMEGMTI